ncbi:hypothetical protein [Archaeoglobus sp.]
MGGVWLNFSIIEGLFFQGFVNVFGSSLVVFLFVLAFFAFLCYSGRLSVEESALVFIPLLFGVIEDGWLPMWVKALFLIGIAVIWGMAVLRIVREG